MAGAFDHHLHVVFPGAQGESFTGNSSWVFVASWDFSSELEEPHLPAIAIAERPRTTRSFFILETTSFNVKQRV
jgi:hypothetical protein